jgi:DNA-binding MarR family transcriptional regulator
MHTARNRGSGEKSWTAFQLRQRLPGYIDPMKAGEHAPGADAAQHALTEPAGANTRPQSGTGFPQRTLDELLCFDVYAASRALTRAYRPLLDPLGLTYPQFLVMQSLWEAEAMSLPEHASPLTVSPPTVGALGERLALDSGTLSPLLRRLEGAGLVTRERGRRDEREVTVVLTSLGREMKARADHVPAEIIRLVNLSERERLTLQSTLRRMRRNVEQTGELNPS